MPELEIRPVQKSEIPSFRSFLVDNNFASGRDNLFYWYSSLGTTTMYLARYEGRMMGTGMSFSSGESGWLGSICVDERYRGRGFGRMLTEYGMERLRNQGALNILLRASKVGSRTYSSLGFRQSGKYENFIVPRIEQESQGEFSDPLVHIGKLSEEHFAMDREFVGEDRSFALSSLPSSSGLEIRRESGLAGFIYPTAGDGFLAMANDTGDLISLMREMMSMKNFKIRTLVGSEGNRYLKERGFESSDGAIRMVLGEDPIKNIKNVVGTISSSIG